jgi:hypothetical protein
VEGRTRSSGDADAGQITSAVEVILTEPGFREEAALRSPAFAGLDGAQIAATSVEALIPRVG